MVSKINRLVLSVYGSVSRASVLLAGPYLCVNLLFERTSLNLCKGIPLKSTGLLSVILTKRASNTATAHSTWTHLQDTHGTTFSALQPLQGSFETKSSCPDAAVHLNHL